MPRYHEFLAGEPQGKLWVPEWQEEILQLAISIATPKAKAAMTEAADQDKFRLWDCTETQACNFNNRIINDKDRRGNLDIRAFAHAHCHPGKEGYGNICFFLPAAIRTFPSLTLIHEFAHFTSSAGHGAAWMKRFRILLERQGFDTSRREVTKYGDPKRQSRQLWNA